MYIIENTAIATYKKYVHMFREQFQQKHMFNLC